MRFRSLLFLALVTIVGSFGAACDVHVGENGVSLDVAGGKATEEWSRTYTLPQGGSLEIVNTNGAIVVNAAAGPQIEVKATRTARAASDEDAQALLKQTSITEAVTPNRIAVQTTNGNGILRGRRSVNVEYQVRVPAGIEINVKTENGGIGLHDVDGSVTAATTNGGIRGTNLSGQYSAHIVNGGIVMDVVRATGPIDLDTVNGGIRLDVPVGLNADVEARAVNGGVSADDSLGLTAAERSRTRLSGKLNGGGVKVSATTVNGGVRIGRLSSSAAPKNEEAVRDTGVTLEKR